MANDISKIKTPDGVVHDLRDRQAVPFVGKNSTNAAQFVRYNDLTQRYEAGLASIHFMVTIPANIGWIEFSIELSLHEWNNSNVRFSKLLITGYHGNGSPYALTKLTATLTGASATNVTNLSAISVSGKTDTDGKIYLYIVGDTTYKTLSVDNLLISDAVAIDLSNVTISTYTTLPSDAVAATMQYNFNPMTAANDLIIGGGNGRPECLAKGSNGTFLGINSSGNIAWNAVPYLLGPAAQAVTKTAGDYTFAYYPRVLASAAGLFPNDGNDANAILTFSKFPGNYYSQLGFNQTGAIYYRNFNGVAINTTNPWSEVVIDYNNPSDGQGDILLRSFGYISGKPLHLDPTFLAGNGDIFVYNNAANGNVILTRDTYSNFGISSPGTGTNYVLRIRNVGSASPNLGGFVCTIDSRANAQFLQVFRAKVPAGYTINMHNNAYGTYGTQAWLTSDRGTGKWEWYVRKITCGEAGSFSSTGYIAFSGTAGTSSAPVDFYIAYHQVYDLTSQAYSALVSQDIPFNAGATYTSAKVSSWVTPTGQNKVYDNQSNKKWISGAAYSSSGWSNSDTGDMRFWLYGDSAGQWLNMNLDGYYFSLKGFIGDSSSATVGLSTAPMYAGYFTNLSANKITATELYGDSIKAALGDYNGVVTYNADTNALSVNTTAAYDAWGKTSGGGIYAPTIQTTPSATSGTVVLVSGNSNANQNGGHLVSDESLDGDTNLIVHSDLSTSMPSATAAGGTTYKLAANNAFNKTPSLNATYAVPIFSNFLYRTTADGSAMPRKPSSVTFDSSNIINLAFSASLNPSASASSLKFGVTTGENNSGAITAGLGIYAKGQIALTNGLFIYNTGGYSLVSGKTVYNSGMAASVHGIRVINDGGQAAIVVGESIVNKVHLATLFGQGHDTTGASQAVCAVGKYSLITSTTAFAVGNGTSVSSRSNAFEVTTDGNGYLGGKELVTIANGKLLNNSDASKALFSDTTPGQHQRAIIVTPTTSLALSTAAAAGATTYTLPATRGFRRYSNLSTYTASLYSNLYFRNGESGTPQKPTSVTVNSDNTVKLTFASSLNPSASTSSLYVGNTIDTNNGTCIMLGGGLYDKAVLSLMCGVYAYNSGQQSLIFGSVNYNSGAGAFVFGDRIYNSGIYSFSMGTEIKNTKNISFVLGMGHDTSSGADGVMTIGQYSSITSTTAFAIGNGTSVSARSNLVEITTAGVVTSSRTTTSSLGTNSVPWHHVHTTGLTIYEAGEVGLPFEGDGFLKYDNDNGLYLDTAVYLPKAGGTVTGVLTFGASSADNRKLVPSANATGYVGTSSVRWGAGYFNALYCGSSNTNVAAKLSDHESRISALEAGTCLIEGTKILMADNSEKNIEDVKEGDLIMSYDPNANKLCEAVVIGNYRTGISNDFTNYYFEDGSYLTIFGGHLVYNAKQGIARHVKHFEPGWTSITPECKETAFIGSESVDNVGHKRHYDLHSSNKLYFANGILNGQSLTLAYARYRDKDFPEEYLQALKADYDAGYNINKFKTDKEVGATLVPILKELKAQKKVMDDNKKRLADSDYLVAKFTEGLISAAEWLKAKAERAGWRSAVNKAEPLYAAAEERYNAFKAKYKAPNTKRERFNAAVARDNACLDALKAYYKSKNEVSK